MVTNFSKKRRLIAENYNKILYMISENNKPQGVTMRKYRTVAIPIDVFEELKQIANQEGRSYARQISWMIKNYFSKTLTSNYYLLYLIYIINFPKIMIF